MDLTKRSEEIIRILLSFSEDHPVSTNLISEKLDISTRSVQREMIYVEKWLNSQGYEIQRKRGKGIAIVATEQAKKELLAILDQNPESDQYIFDRDQRQNHIKFELLMAEEPLKIYYLTDKCDVSEGTLFNDLNQITPWFRSYGINLIRRTGLGIFVRGEELYIRRALTSTVLGIIEQSHALDKHSRGNVHQYFQFIKQYDMTISEKINEIMSECEEKFGVVFSDQGYIALIFYLIVMCHHVIKGKTIIVDDLEQEKLLIQPEYGVAEHLANEIGRRLGIMVSRDEICGIAMQIGSTRNIPSGRKDLTKRRDFDIHQIVISIIKEVSEITFIDFTTDSHLVNDLSIHIQPTIGRLRSRIPIDNPLLDNLKEDYPDIFEACEKACDKVFKEVFSLDEVPSSEVGFVTMHFGAAMERKEKNERRIRVVIVCPTGIGTSRLLAADLKLEYPFLDIKGTQSAFDINPRNLFQEGIDLIISTVKLETTFRYVQVNTILTKHDKALIHNRIEYLLRQKKKENAPFVVPSRNIKRADIDYISMLGEMIYELLDQIYIHSAPIIHNREELIQYAARCCSPKPEITADVHQLLKDRDDLNDTYVKPFHALLLHARSDIIEKPCFQYVRLEPPFYESGKVILGAIVSLIPKNGVINKVSSSVLSELIGLLLDNGQLLAAMRSGNIGMLRDLVEYELLGFYRKHVAEILDIPMEY